MQGVPNFADAPPHAYVVILSDPGAGKSTLLRSLAVQWAQQQTTEQIPLLIELRRYIQSKEKQECLDFVEFIHKGSNWVNHLDQQQLDNWLNQGQVMVLLERPRPPALAEAGFPSRSTGRCTRSGGQGDRP